MQLKKAHWKEIRMNVEGQFTICRCGNKDGEIGEKKKSSTSYLKGKLVILNTSEIFKSLLYRVPMSSVHTISGNDYVFSKMQQHVMKSISDKPSSIRP